MLNIDAIIGLAISTAFLRADFDNQTSPSEVEEQNAWDGIADQALDYLRWVGVEIADIEIDKYTIAQCIWGKDSDQLDEELSDS